MAVTLTPVNRGTVPGDKTGDEPYDAFGKVNTSDSALKAGVDLVLDLPQSTILGRVTAGTGDPEKLTTAQVKTLLDLTGTNSGDQTSIVGITGTIAQFNTALTDGSFATGGGTATGTNTGDQTITLTGDVTGSGTGSFAATIANSAVTLAKMADVATGTVFYRKTAATGVPEVQTLATLKTDLGLTGTNSGDQTSIVGITGSLAEFNTALTGADFATGGGTATGTNTGDQTSLTGISDTKANFDTALSDGSFMFTEVATLNDLAGVINSFAALSDGQVLTYDTVNGWQNETPSSGVSDHTLLTNIGTNTHAQIDTHLALTDEHINWKGTTESLSTSGTVIGGFVKSSNGFINTVSVSTGGISGGSALNLGANILLYGESHGSQPFDMVFRSSGVTELFFDYSGNIWDFQSNAIFTNGPITATGAISGSNVSGTNTGDQTSIVGISGTTAEFNTALSDGSFAISGGAFHDGFSDYVANEHIDWTSATSSLVTTGSITSLLFKMSSSNGIVNTSSLANSAISGGSASNLGANMLLYGQSHGSTPFDIVFRSSSVTELIFDYSADLWDFQANAITTTGAITGGSFETAHGTYPSGNLNYTGTIEKVIAGATVTAGYLVMLQNDAARFECVHATDATSAPILGVAITGGAAGTEIDVLVRGTVKLTGAHFTPTGNQFCYASTTAGNITSTVTTTSGDFVKIAGWCVADDVMYVNPQWNFVEVA